MVMPAMLTVNFLVLLGFNLFYVAFPVHAAGPLGWVAAQAEICSAARRATSTSPRATVT